MSGIISGAYSLGQEACLQKLAGGPGSGVKGYNTAHIGHYPKSPYVSVGTRKALLDNMDYHKDQINLKDVSHVAQDKYVPDKVQAMLKNPEIIDKKPIDVLQVGEKYHVVDGHHRFLVALLLGKHRLHANVRVKAEKTMNGSK
jgi:hypothetical protein